MRSAADTNDVRAWTAAGALTATESSFPNAKLRDLHLIGYKAFADAAAKGSLFVVTLVAARRLTPHDFGIVALGSTVGWTLAVASDFGVQMNLARAVARRPDHAAAALRRWLTVRVWSTVAALALVGGALALLRTPTGAARAVALFALVYALNGLVEFLNYYYRGLSRSDIESTLTLWQRGGTLVFGVGALLVRPTPVALGAAMLVPVTASLTWSLRLALASAPPPRIDAPAWRTIGAEFSRDVAPIGAGIVLSALYFRIDVLLIEWWSGTEAVAGYNAVFRLVDAMRLVPAAVLAVTLPALCRSTDLKPLARVSAAVTAFAAAAAIPLTWAAGWLVPALYGERYRAAVPAFRVLMLSFPLLSLNFALTHQLIGWNRHRFYAALCAAALVVNVALNARLIPSLSIAGAAWATLGTELFLTMGCVLALV